jgi:hypothetical protein
MAEMNGGQCTLIATLSGCVSTSLSTRTRVLSRTLDDWDEQISLTRQTTMFTLYHCYMFDRLRCLIPSRRHWHRCMLVYMLIMSSLGMFIWASTWGCK